METWSAFDWSGQATSPYCVIAGDIARDRTIVVQTLTELSKVYQGGVFYIDGNDEHRYFLEELSESYSDLVQAIEQIPGVVYLQDNVVIINGIALLGTNGWWGYDFDPAIDYDQTLAWFKDKIQVSHEAAVNINSVAMHDAAYLINSVKKLQKHKEADKIVLITHTVPAPWLVSHDIELTDTWRFNCTGNRHVLAALDEDTENKIVAWCFGHYHGPVDRMNQGIRYVNNCRGRGDTPWCQTAYYPKRIEID
jgi:hypothetical protein